METFNPRRILCPVDMSELSDLSLKYAYAGAHLFQASLTVLHAAHFEYPRYLSRELTDRVMEELKNARAAIGKDLEDHVRKVLGSAVDAVDVSYEPSDLPPDEAVLKVASDKAADLIVMGTHGYGGFRKFMLGSVTESVLHRSETPVFAVRQKSNDFIDTTRPEEQPRIRRLLCPCNMSPAAGRGLQVAGVLADRFQARLTALWSPEDGEAADEERFSAWVDSTLEAKTSVETVVRGGEPASAAIGLARETGCDLIVIGARRRPFERGTEMGRTTERVLRHGPVPALAVPYE